MQVVLEFSFDKKAYPSHDDALYALQEKILEKEIATLPYFENESIFLIVNEEDLEKTRNITTKLTHLKLESEKLIEEIDWVKNLKDNFEDLKFKKFNIVSSLKKNEEDRLIGHNFFIKAGTGFGTGHHPTTHMLLSIIEENESFFQNATDIIDLGCGSGILAIVISDLYKKDVLGIDNDELALENAKHNVELNKADQVSLSLANKLPKNKTYDVIVANLFSELLIEFSNNFYNSLKTNGKLLISGILNEQVKEVRSKLGKTGLKEIISKNKTDENSNTWHALVFQK